jgi:hypothetical protein
MGTITIILNNGKYKHIYKVLHVLEMAKNSVFAQEFRKDGLGIHLAKEILLKTKVTNPIEVNGLFNTRGKSHPE